MAGGANVSDLEYLSDLVLVSSDGERFLVHKVFVAKYSVFFRNMFSECCATKPPAAKKKKDGKYGAVEAMETLKLDDVSSETMKPLISLMYCTTGSRSMKHISADNVKSLTEVARKYDMPQLMVVCSRFCTKKLALEVNTVLEWRSFAQEYSLDEFRKTCARFLSENIKGVLEGMTDEQLEGLPSAITVKLLRIAAAALGMERARHCDEYCLDDDDDEEVDFDEEEEEYDDDDDEDEDPDGYGAYY